MSKCFEKVFYLSGKKFFRPSRKGAKTGDWKDFEWAEGYFFLLIR